ncbi:hypothetical protein DXG03_003066 [Asterophora parasitica]|uniref:Rhodanese domain-containing protein n=1 Tax=Asterophora parasitica TaxID=117018 RepID=A0A9P7G3S4_9AGAR|nr:hypothetical protein DXG03_003066 [Asterophora parasitica]
MISQSLETQSNPSEDSPVVIRTPPALRTLDDVRLQVANEVAVRAITKSDNIEGIRVGVSLTLSKSDDDSFLHQVADVIAHKLALGGFLFAVATTSPSEVPNPLIIVGSSQEFVQRAILLISSKFLGRIVHSGDATNPQRWTAHIKAIGSSTYDEDALWDALRKATQSPIDPLEPPPGSRGIDQILADTRAKLQRITPEQAFKELKEPQVGAPTFLVDIRPVAQREHFGGIHGSLVIERNVLEWRFDPRNFESRLPIADRYDLRVLELGLLNATDVIGGFKAWQEAGLPTDGKGLSGIGLEPAQSITSEAA